jgi:hypothetical protein
MAAGPWAIPEIAASWPWSEPSRQAERTRVSARGDVERCAVLLQLLARHGG